MSVPFENLDVQLGRTLGISLDAAFDKIVTRRRGGWCYEQNGLLGWALAQIGFDVQRTHAGVRRAEMGDAMLGNHLTLIVALDGQLWLVDAGFGGSQAKPIPLSKGNHDHPRYALTLARTDDGYWRFSEHAAGSASGISFDFRDEPADETLLVDQCVWQQSSPHSNFTLNLVAQRRIGDRHIALRDRAFTETTAQGRSRHLLNNANALVAALRDTMDLDLPEAAGLWPRVAARHSALFPDGEPVSA
ncbi:arylamine N-acetyltransferase family protein [Sphingomonas sp. LT1P40]|uniref:arylamine N-acetyltransferase family protein n=1 Tax=Alteristakelama amylovorans TaxID=3096166 RepID=UPI002FC5FAA5